MKKNLIICALTVGLLSSCLDQTYLKSDLEVGFREEPKWSVPGVHGAANLFELLVGQDEGKKTGIVLGENGVLKLHNRFASVYRVSLADLVAPEKKVVENTIKLPDIPDGVFGDQVLDLLRTLPPTSGELEISLPQEVSQVNRFVASTKLEMILPSGFPLVADYELSFANVTQGGAPLVLKLSDPDGDGRYSVDVDHFEVKTLSRSNKVKLPYTLRIIPRSMKNSSPWASGSKATVKLSDIAAHIFEGKISDQSDVEIADPISFGYDEWPKIENLALLGSKLSVEASYHGRIGLGLKAKVSVTGKNGNKLTLRPSIPILKLNTTGQGQKGQVTEVFTGEDIDKILSFLSKTGVSVEALSLNFTPEVVYIDETSFIDLSLILDIPLHLKFSRMPFEFSFNSPKVDLEDVLGSEDKGIRKFSLNLNTVSSLPVGIKVKGLTLLDQDKQPVEGGFVPFDFELPAAVDAAAKESVQKISISLEQMRLLKHSAHIRVEGAAVSTGEWIDLRPEQNVRFSLAVFINE